jgi:alpha-L-rhamnosidase
MIDRGATTVWERWEGIDDQGVPHESLNHYSKGAVISFLHRYVAGIERVELTYRRFRVQPRPGGGLTWAKAEHETPHGRLASSWRIEGDVLELEVTVPPGCTADIVLPSGQPSTVGAGTHHWMSTTS